MPNIGFPNDLIVLDKTPAGATLDGQDLGPITLPKQHMPIYCKVGQNLTVFVYPGDHGELLASTQMPTCYLGQCAFLAVKSVSPFGAFLDWGMQKDLLVPHNEQQQPMQVGRKYVVYCYQDAHTGRLTGSTRLHHHLSETRDNFKINQAVDLLVCGRSELGYKAVIDHSHLGLIFHADVFQAIRIGKRVKGYIKSLRDDGKINLSLTRNDAASRDHLKDAILEHLKQHGGRSTLTDRSLPADIYRTFSASKSNYKKALGGLYKQRLITIEKDCIVLNPNPKQRTP